MQQQKLCEGMRKEMKYTHSYQFGITKLPLLLLTRETFRSTGFLDFIHHPKF
jgi:hypothetical protein